MNIEEKIMKEKRDRILEDIRKPILLTPGSKRGRHEEGEWEQAVPDAGTPPACQAGGSRLKMKQTPIQSFFVSQTLEAHQIYLNTKPRITKTPAPANIYKDMSASSASPNLRKAVRKRTKVQKIQENVRRQPMSAGKVSLITQYFEWSTRATRR